MSADPSPSPVSRRIVLQTAVWAAPVVALAASAPAAAASGAPTFALVFGQNPLVMQSAPVATTTLSVQNTGASAATGSVSVVISGMASDGFTLGSVPTGGWSYTGGSSDDTLYFTWNGTLEAGGSSDLILVVQYSGTSPRPITGSLLVTPTDAGIAAITLQIQLPDEG